MSKSIKKNKMLQISEETHKMLKVYCDKHGFKMGGFVSALVKQAIFGKKDR
jgi:hypothetical protein